MRHLEKGRRDTWKGSDSHGGLCSYVAFSFCNRYGNNYNIFFNLGALLQLPIAIADNAGYDSAQLVSELRAAHAQGKHSYGLDMENGKVACMKELGITESFAVKRQVLLSAAEAAELILRVDNIIKAAPRRRVPDRGYC